MNQNECHNFLRLALKIANDKLLVCGTHAFSPKCRMYKFQVNNYQYVEDHQYSGQAIVPYDPNHNSTFVYIKEQSELLVGTVSDIAAHNALLYQLKVDLSNNTKGLRTPNNEGIFNHPQFVGSFIYKSYAYFWFREKAIESQDNNGEMQLYARVGRVCIKNKVSFTPSFDRFTTFLKARLNCSLTNNEFTTPFYFNEIQSISMVVEDEANDGLVFAVFHTTKSFLLSAICSYKLSQITNIFDEIRIKTQNSPNSKWDVNQKFYKKNNKEKPGRCNGNIQSLQDIAFLSKNPLIYDLIPSENHKPLLIEGPGKAAIISIDAYKHKISSVRNQLHYVLYIGRDDGSIAKVTFVNKATILIENVQVFAKNKPVIDLKIIDKPMRNVIIVVSRNEVAVIPTQHCHYKKTCSQCVGLRDPHCAWDIDNLQCINKKNWSDGNFVQNIIKGISEQCSNLMPMDLTNSIFYSDILLLQKQNKKLESKLGHDLKKNNNNDSINISNFVSYSTTNLSFVIIFLIVSLFVGFMIGYKVSKWQLLNILANRPVSSNRSENSYNSLVQNPANKKNESILNENNYIPIRRNSSINSANDIQINEIYGNHIPFTGSHSHAGSGFSTPRREARNIIISPDNQADSSALSDYKIKKVYL